MSIMHVILFIHVLLLYCLFGGFGINMYYCECNQHDKQTVVFFCCCCFLWSCFFFFYDLSSLQKSCQFFSLFSVCSTMYMHKVCAKDNKIILLVVHVDASSSMWPPCPPHSKQHSFLYLLCNVITPLYLWFASYSAFWTTWLFLNST